MQIGGGGIQNLLVNMTLKKNFKKTKKKKKKTPFHVSSFDNRFNKFQSTTIYGM
jgi:hypothetical protein